MFASMHRLKSLPDYVEVLPGAFSGSLCGRRLSGNPSSTIGFERRHNRAFAMDDEDEFVRDMLRDVPRSPVDAARIRAVNAGFDAAM
jgi:hydroxyacylglutathione hydrolase